MTIIEKIIAAHSNRDAVSPGEIVWMDVDYRSARDFGGPNVVGHLEAKCSGNPLAEPDRTYFTFDTNAPANTTGYADNQHRCRMFARRWGAHLYDVDSGIGTHIAMEQRLVRPGMTAVGTDSHFNILGAVGAFGQGMGDLDVAYIFRSGRTWFEVPATIRVDLTGIPPQNVTAKDLALFLLAKLGTNHALGKAVEITGPAVEQLDLSGRITLCSMATEAGAIAFFPPLSEAVTQHYDAGNGASVQPQADAGSAYAVHYEFDVSNLLPLASPPGTPNGGMPVDSIGDVTVDSVFVGSCTNGGWDDFRAVAEILGGKHVHKNVILKMVPATREVYARILADGILKTLIDSGAVVSQPGCGGCASGQIGMTGRGEVQVSTSNRNFRGKQGLGDTWLASPRTAAWTALRGKLCNKD